MDAQVCTEAQKMLGEDKHKKVIELLPKSLDDVKFNLLAIPIAAAVTLPPLKEKDPETYYLIKSKFRGLLKNMDEAKVEIEKLLNDCQ